MIKLLLLFITINFIASDQILTISVKEKRLINAGEGDILPLIVKSSETVAQEIEFQCNGNIRYNPGDGSDHTYDVGDVDPQNLPKIPKGTTAGTEIQFNCKFYFETENTVITLVLDNRFKVKSGGDNLNWQVDENNKKIELVSKFIVVPSYSTSKNLEKNGTISLDITLMEDIANAISIEDKTFILTKENQNDTSINLISCSDIPANSQKGNVKITCLIEEEVKNGKFLLKLGEGKKIDNIEPKVSGSINFSSTSTSTNNSLNYSNILKICLTISILLF